MTTTRLALPLLMVALTGALNRAYAVNTDGTVTYTVTTQNYAASYDPRNISAVWVTDGNGVFVKTLDAHAGVRIQYLRSWNANRGKTNNLDGVTGATLNTQPQTYAVTWDCRGTNGLVVADGTYYVRAEYTSNNGQGPYLSTACPFAKGASAVSTNYPNFSNASGQFTGMSLTYTPTADVGLTSILPCCGMVDTNVTLHIAATNLTLNPATFSVAVSNLTSGTLIGTQAVTAMAGGAATNLTVNWNTAGLSSGIYSVQAVASGLAGETALANNAVTADITLSTASASDIEILRIAPSVGLLDALVPVSILITNTTPAATGPFLVALTNLTGSTFTSGSNTWQVSTGNDDAEENDDAVHNVSTTSSDLELVYDEPNQIVGVRFQNLAIPPSASITSANIRFRGTDSVGNQNPISLTIRGQASDNAATFAATASNVSGRPDTSASVSWAPPNWVNNEAGPNAITPDLKTVVQEIVDRPGWAAGNAMAFTVTGTGRRRAVSYNGNAANAPQLIAQWTTSSALIGSQQVANLAGLASTNIVIAWNTAGMTAGVHRVRAVAGAVAGEVHVDDNTLVGEITLRPPLHNLAVGAIVIAPVVPPNVSTNVVVSVTNAGDFAESFTHTLRDVTAAPVTIGSTAVGSLAAGAQTNLFYAWNTTTNAGFALGYHTLQADVTVVANETSAADNTNTVQVIVSSGMATNTLVARNAVWKYLDQGLDISLAPWQFETYYDGFWSSGAAPLGYGLPSIATTVGFGGVPSNRYPTTYFRREFTMDFPPTALAGSMLRTHGAVLYLNGVEVVRQNMPLGSVEFGTLASSTVSGSAATNYFAFTVPPEAVRIGQNLVTAELHLDAVTNTTAGFSLEITSVNPAVPSLPAVAATAVEPEGTVQSGDSLGVLITLVNSGNATTSCLVLLVDASTGAVLASQNVASLAPGESTVVHLAWPTFGATTGAHTLQAVTVINGVTNLAGSATAPITLDPLSFAARKVDAAGSIGGRCSAVAVSANTVYLGCGATLEAWDASVPAAPVRVGAVRLPGIIEDLAVSNNWVYAATGVAGVQIVDASQATQLLHRATFDSSGFARRLALEGNLLYVADAVAGVRILDVTSPAAPTLAGAYQTTGPAQTVTRTPPRLLVLDGQHGLQNLHAANPAAMTVTGALSQVTAGLALTVVPGAALVTDASGFAFRIDTSAPATPVIAASALLPAAGRGLAVSASGTALYVAAGVAGLLTLNPTTLATLGTIASGDEAYDVAVSGNTLYVADGFAGCRSLTITSPLSPQPLAVYATGARPVDAAAVGSRLLVAADEGGLQVHSLQELALPTRLLSLASVTNSRCVEIAYPLAFVGDGLYGFKVLSITNPAAPALLGSYPATGLSHIHRMGVAGTRAVVTDGRVLQLLSVANPALPTLLATVTNTPGSFVFDVATVSNHLYAACGNSGLRVYGLNTGLSLDGTYATPGPATGVAAASNLLQVACGPYGWTTLSIANPTSPALVKNSATGMAFGSAAAGPLVYLADGARVGRALNVSAPLTPVAVTNVANLTRALRVRAVQGLMLTVEDEAGLAILNASPGDINLNGIPDDWEQQIVAASLATNGPIRSVLDVDAQAIGPNGFPYYQSYLAGLSPTDPNSVLAISALTPLAGGGQFVVQWHSVPGKSYTVYKTTDLSVAFQPIPAATGLLATTVLSSFTDTVDTPQAFYIVGLAP